MSRYNALVTAMKALAQGETPNATILPMAENEWYTRPDAVSYGTIQLDFEANELYGDNTKTDIAYEGSVDLFSKSRTGEGWRALIEACLETYCDGCWYLSASAYERETNLFHWEWVFQIEG